MNPNLLALLPELILTLAGVLVMLAEPMLPPTASRKPLGWFAAVAALGAGAASWFQLHTVAANHGIAILAFSNNLQVDAFSVFFHFLIAAVLLVTLLASFDFFDRHQGNAGEYFALLLFAATGMMLMCSATELLVVFVGLEISSISTYILAGFRKGNGASAESSLKYFLLGSFATAFFLYGIALAFGATGSTSLATIGLVFSGQVAPALPTAPLLAYLSMAMILIGLGFKVSAAPFHVWTPDVYQGAPCPRRRLHVHRPQGRRLRRPAPHLLCRLRRHAAPLGSHALGHGRPVHDHRQPRRAPPAQRQAHARLFFHRARRLPARRLHRPACPGRLHRRLLHRRLRRHERRCLRRRHRSSPVPPSTPAPSRTTPAPPSAARSSAPCSPSSSFP